MKPEKATELLQKAQDLRNELVLLAIQDDVGNIPYQLSSSAGSMAGVVIHLTSVCQTLGAEVPQDSYTPKPLEIEYKEEDFT